MKRLFLAALLSLSCAAHAADGSAPSRALSDITGSVVGGSAVAVLVAGSVVVGVDKIADGIELVLKNAADGSRATVRLSGKAAEGLSVAAGTVLDVTATASGHLLVMSGKAIAFIPNEAGKALLHSAKVGA
ncbi:hypothetical protein IP92_02061 [Pseudoduganella flava]|uniref:DUF5666 domain-containing protein n=1 Tax=Pseudoduganella flava TaxID=871742 RepID=A0A562PW78_9BURK|nr:hypothetical protein [Pseudoduganella flava]QGZ39757.1 hypothetical protein GO485_12310 [Pseudoduganella flava]TWI48669.1 hypothetical protein IP92_02061 [Pseudoduganella flava]